MSTRRFSTLRLLLISGLLAAAVVTGNPWADAGQIKQGTLVSACAGTIGCPAKLKLTGPVDSLDFKALLTAQSGLNPLNRPFTLTVRNASGLVFTETLGGGNITKQGRTYQFRDPNARQVGGFSRITLRRKGNGQWRVSVIAHGDMSRATIASMIVELTIGDDLFATQNDWSRREFGWLLHLPATPTPPTPTPTPIGPTPTPNPTPTITSTTTPTPSPTPIGPTPTPAPTPTNEPYGSVFEAFVAAPGSLLR